MAEIHELMMLKVCLFFIFFDDCEMNQSGIMLFQRSFGYCCLRRKFSFNSLTIDFHSKVFSQGEIRTCIFKI